MTHFNNEPNFRLNFNGKTLPFTGYGKANLNWLVALDKATGGGVSCEWDRGINEDGMVNLTPAQKAVLNKPFVREKIGVIQTTPAEFIHNTFRCTVGYTMTEYNKVSSVWREQFKQLDFLFVPSQGALDVFRNAGINTPAFVIHEGYNPDDHYYFERPQRDVFTFLLLGYLDERKNWMDIVRAFTSEFGSREPVRLLLKNSNPLFGYKMPIDPRIKVINHFLSTEQLQRLYEISDCLVFTTRGEGFGLPPLEAMATGLPVILTKWLGSAEYCNDHYNYSIDPIAIDYPVEIKGEDPGYMARLDVREIMYWMRYIYENREEAAAKGKLAAEWMRTAWTWDHAATKMLIALKEIDKNWISNCDFACRMDYVDTGPYLSGQAFLKRFVGVATNALQVGCYEGGSTLWFLENILTHPDSRLTNIDRFYGEDVMKDVDFVSVKKRYFDNIAKCPFVDKLTTIVGDSKEELKNLPRNSFDWIYVDGSHLAKDVTVDAELSFNLLKIGGLLFFDDYDWHRDFPPDQIPHFALNEFMVKYDGCFKLLYQEIQLFIEKTKDYEKKD